MRIVVISPESEDPRELPAMDGFFMAGLERYHVRKPSWSRDALEAWLGKLPAAWRPRLILHQHHALSAKLGIGGTHDRDREEVPTPGAVSRSCHAVESLRRSLPHYESVLFGPVFASLTKQGYGPAADFPWDELTSLLLARTPDQARVLAIGGVTAAGLTRCRELGLDGAAVLGAVWNDRDPVAAFVSLRDAAAGMEARRHAA
jgi:thiamine-phosphate pyrophosphorylase